MPAPEWLPTFPNQCSRIERTLIMWSHDVAQKQQGEPFGGPVAVASPSHSLCGVREVNEGKPIVRNFGSRDGTVLVWSRFVAKGSLPFKAQSRI